MQRQIIILLQLILLLSCTGCGSLEIPEEELNVMCEAEAGLHTDGPIQVDGFYYPGEEDFSLKSMIAILSFDRFQYIELDTDASPLYLHLVKFYQQPNMSDQYKARYIRFSVAKRGDPRCMAYEEYLKSNEKAIATHKVYGLHPNACIAVEYTDFLLSEYGVFDRAELDPRYPNSAWIFFEIRHLATDTVKTDFSIFQYCKEGFSEKETCHGGKKNLFLCPPSARKTRLNRYTFFHQALFATPNPLLAPKLTDKVINVPIPQPIPEGRPVLLETIEREESLSSITGAKAQNIFFPRDPNGFTWISKHPITFTLNGEKRRATQPHLSIINEKERKLLKVNINIGQEGKRWGYRFSSIRTIPSEAIYFIAWGGRQETHEPAENFYILCYSWEGALKRITKGTLPFEFLRIGAPHHHYANLSIHEDHYRFSILEEEGDTLSQDRIQSSREYRFKLQF